MPKMVIVSLTERETVQLLQAAAGAPLTEKGYDALRKLRAALQKPAVVPSALCPKHPHLKLRCQGCAGAIGGAVKSAKKAKAAAANWKLALEAQQEAK